jgi:formimidoylglutamate deiminase
MTVLWAEQALLPAGWARDVRVTLAEGRIVAVEAGARPAGQRLAVLLPAPANAHSHAFQRAMAGLTEARSGAGRDSFWTWRQLMFRFLDRLDPEAIEAIAAFVQMEMLEAGYAASVEFHYLHHAPGGRPYAEPSETSQRIAAAAATSGIGLTLLPVLYQFGGCDRRPLGPGQVRFGSDLSGFARLHEGAGRALAALPGDARLGIAPHSLRAVAAQDLPALRALAGGAPFHMHLAEQVAEVEEVQAALGARPVDWVLHHLAPDAGCTFIHCTQMEPQETLGLAASGAVAGLCPITEASLGDGIFDGPRWLEAGGAIALGSDSNIRISLSEEIRQLEYSQRLRDRARAVLATEGQSTGRRLWEAACAGGARAAGRDSGAIAPGLRADLVALDGGHPDLAGRRGDTLIDAFAFAGGPGMVAEVWSAGRHLVQGGRHIARGAITAAYLRAVGPLVADL